MTRILLLLFFISTFTSYTSSQDSQYWSDSYGPSSFLVPGSFIADNQDSIGFCYNPALLAFYEKNTISVSGNLYSYGGTRIKNGLGDGYDIESTKYSVTPIVASQVLSLKLKNPITFGYALVNIPIMDYNVSQRADTRSNVLEDWYSPGKEQYFGLYGLQNFSSEIRGIFSIGMKAGKSFSWGFSGEFNIFRQDLTQNLSSLAVWNTTSGILQPTSSYKSYYQVKYYASSIRLKFGFAYDITANHHLGLVIKPPIFRVGGSGTILASEEFSNLYTDPDNYPISIVASSRQTGISARRKTPWSIALGYDISYPKGDIYIVGEYFAPVAQYDIMESNDPNFIRDDVLREFVSEDALNVINAADAIFNLGINLSYSLSDRLATFFSFSTDYCYLPDDLINREVEGLVVNSSVINNFHFQTGLSLKRRNFNLRFGTLFTLGRSDDYLSPIDFNNIKVSNGLVGDPSTRTARDFRVSLLFSYVKNI